MKKINLMLVCLLLMIVTVQAQSTEAIADTVKPMATAGTIMYDKTSVPCYTIEMPFSEDVAKEAIKKRFKQFGASSKERKGFMEFKNVSIPEIRNGSLVDAYINVDRKSKKEKDNSLVSLIITDPGVLPGTTSAYTTDSGGTALAGVGMAAAGASSLLASLHENSADYSLELAIKKQEETVKKADREYNNLVKDAEDLQNKLKKTQNEIEANKIKQAQQAEVVKKEKEALLQVQAKRRSQ